MTIECL